MADMENIDIPEFIATVAEQLKEANEKANRRIREKQDDPFLSLSDVQLQIAFTAEESKTTKGKLELKPWVVSAGGERSKNKREAIVHMVTVGLAPVPPERSVEVTPEKTKKDKPSEPTPTGGGAPSFLGPNIMYR